MPTLDLSLDSGPKLRQQNHQSRLQAQIGRLSYPLGDVVEKWRQIAHVGSREHWVQHLALLLVGRAVRCQ